MTKLVTILGGSGFVGRYIARRMAKAGWRVRVATRRPNEHLFVRTCGVVGQVEPVLCNIRNAESLRAVINGSDAVVNCVGILSESRKNTFDAVQTEGAGMAAQIAADTGVAQFVHISAIGADAESDSTYMRTKAAGEAAVQNAFPNAVILRPSIIFGAEDQFFNRFAGMTRLSPFLPIAGGGTLFQPVYVDDVAHAAAKAAMGGAEPGVYELGGPEVSFNNLLDFDAALNVLSSFTAPTIAIMKHTNPCGLSSDENLAKAYQEALSGDPVAAFGGVVGSNQIIDLATAREIDRSHYDAIIAPRYENEALELLGRKKNLRLVEVPAAYSKSEGDREPSLEFRYIEGGFLAQIADFFSESEFRPGVVTQRQPTEIELSDLFFAWKAVKSIKSNAIVIAKDKTLLGMGAGQPSRVVSVELALKKAGDRVKNSVLASDAFFPFPDGPELAAKSGVVAIIQPGGSVKDKEVIEIADKYNLAMVFTGARHFRH